MYPEQSYAHTLCSRYNHPNDTNEFIVVITHDLNFLDSIIAVKEMLCLTNMYNIKLVLARETMGQHIGYGTASFPREINRFSNRPIDFSSEGVLPE